MLEQKVISFLKEKNWWYQDESIDYRNVLSNLGVDMNSDFIQFYLHAEDGPTFYSRGKEIYQLGWFLINTNLLRNLYSINKSLDLSEDYIPLDSFEGENGFFYNAKIAEVFHFKLSEQDRVIRKWSSFSKFIEWYFDI